MIKLEMGDMHGKNKKFDKIILKIIKKLLNKYYMV